MTGTNTVRAAMRLSGWERPTLTGAELLWKWGQWRRFACSILWGSRCNKRLKNVVLQAVEKVRLFGPEDLRQAAQELEARGAHTEFALAKRLVRLAKYLVTTGTIYRPKALLDPDTPKEKPVLYYQAAWDKLVQKWKGKADLKDVFAAEHALGQWRNMARELYALELRLPQQRAGRRAGALTP